MKWKLWKNYKIRKKQLDKVQIKEALGLLEWMGQVTKQKKWTENNKYW